MLSFLSTLGNRLQYRDNGAHIVLCKELDIGIHKYGKQNNVLLLQSMRMSTYLEPTYAAKLRLLQCNTQVKQFKQHNCLPSCFPHTIILPCKISGHLDLMSNAKHCSYSAVSRDCCINLYVHTTQLSAQIVEWYVHYTTVHIKICATRQQGPWFDLCTCLQRTRYPWSKIQYFLKKAPVQRWVKLLRLLWRVKMKIATDLYARLYWCYQYILCYGLFLPPLKNKDCCFYHAKMKVHGFC